MIICVLAALLVVALLYWKMKGGEIDKLTYACVVYLIALLAFTIWVSNSRNITTIAFSESMKASECKIGEDDGFTTIRNGEHVYVVRNSRIMYYKAERPEDEMVELSGKIYKKTPSVPDSIYSLVFLENPKPVVEYYIETVNISKVE